MSEIKPCPFCGGEASVIGIRDGRQVSCKGLPRARCFAQGPAVYHGPDGWDACEVQAISAWNTRPIEDDLSASLNRASDACASVQRERDALREMLGEFEQQLLDVGASLAAAISLLERAPATIAPSKKMFDQMKADYRASLERARAFLSRYEGEVK